MCWRKLSQGPAVPLDKVLLEDHSLKVSPHILSQGPAVPPDKVLLEDHSLKMSPHILSQGAENPNQINST